MFSGMDSFWSLVSRGMVEGQKAMLRSIDVLNHGLFLLDSYYQRYDGGSEGEMQRLTDVFSHGLFLLESCY